MFGGKKNMCECGLFVISLDFELLWGIKDLEMSEEYKENVYGARKAIPKILELFKKYGVHATWATVGIMLNSNKNEIENNIPSKLPNYENANCSAYVHLNEVGKSEKEDKLHYAGELLRTIQAYPHQEIGSHSYSHYYCTEVGADGESFCCDIQNAIRITENKCGTKVLSFVFPRNQYTNESLKVLNENGIKCYRGNPKNGYDSTKIGLGKFVQKIIRFLDSYFSLEGPVTYKIENNGDEIINVPASRFLRPYSGIKALEHLKIKRIKGQMQYAAMHNELFHLWWHPHNFGKNTDEMINELVEILEAYKELRENNGFMSVNMKEYMEICHEK